MLCYIRHIKINIAGKGEMASTEEIVRVSEVCVATFSFFFAGDDRNKVKKKFK